MHLMWHIRASHWWIWGTTVVRVPCPGAPPESTSQVEECVPSSSTCWVRPIRKLCIISVLYYECHSGQVFISSRLCGKAFERSRRMASICFPLDTFFASSCTVVMSWVSLHVIVRPDWRYEHGPLMNLEDGVAYPGGVSIIHYGDDGVWCPLLQLTMCSCGRKGSAITCLRNLNSIMFCKIMICQFHSMFFRRRGR